MSFGIFESAISSEAEVGLVKQAASDKFASAVYDVRQKLGASLFASRSLDEFRDRVEMMKNDQSIYKVISASIHPNTGTVRRIVGRNSVLEQEFLTRLAVDGMGASSPDAVPGATPGAMPDAGPGVTSAAPAVAQPPMTGTMARLHRATGDERPIQDLDVTYHSSDGLLDPKGDFKGYQNRVDQGGPSKVQSDFVSGSGGDNFVGSPESNFAPAKMAVRVYADWCEANRTDPGRMASLDAYAGNISDEQYFTIAAAMQADPSFSTMPSINQSAGSSPSGGTIHMPAVQPTKALTGGPHQNWPDQTMVKNWNKAGGLRRQADDSDPTRPGISDELGGAANFLNGLPQPHPTQAPAKGYSPDLEGVGKAIWHGVVGGDTAPDSPAPATGTLPLPGANGPNRVNNPAAPTGGTPAATNAGAVSQAPGGTGVGSPPGGASASPSWGMPNPNNVAGGYSTQSGDTMSDIAKTKGVGLPELEKANPQVSDPNKINVNQNLNIPAAGTGAGKGTGWGMAPGGTPKTPTAPATGLGNSLGLGAGLKASSRDPLPHYIAWCDSNGLKRISAANVEYYSRGNVPLTMHLANRMKTAIHTARIRQAYDQDKSWGGDPDYKDIDTNAQQGYRQADEDSAVDRGMKSYDDSIAEHGDMFYGPGKRGPKFSPEYLKANPKAHHGRRRHAAPDYLQKADEALTQLLNQKAQEFQETIAPLQQALQTVQQAEQLQQQASPLNVVPPAGTVNVLPGQDQGGAPMSGQDAMGMAQQLGGGAPPPPGGGDPSAPPPAAGDQGALPPDMQMQGSRRRGGRGKDSGLRAAANVSDLWDKFQGAGGNHLGGDYDYEQFANQFGVGTKALEKLKNQHQQGFTASRLDFTR